MTSVFDFQLAHVQGCTFNVQRISVFSFRFHDFLEGLLHPWLGKDCSLFTNALFYSPVRPYRPPPWPGPTSRVHASMRLSRKSDRYVRYVRYATLRALHAAMEATAVHEVGGAPLLAVNMA